MPTFGQTANSASSSVSTSDKAIASQATPASSGVVDTGTARLWIDAGGTPVPVSMCIWRDDSGEPESLIALSNQKTISNTTEQEHQFAFTGIDRINVVSGTPYWVGLTWPNPGAGANDNINYSRDVVTGGRREVNQHAPNPFGTPLATTAGPIDAYITYLLPSAEADGAFFAMF